jgi:hypothetical protein
MKDASAAAIVVRLNISPPQPAPPPAVHRDSRLQLRGAQIMAAIGDEQVLRPLLPSDFCRRRHGCISGTQAALMG